MAEVRLGRLEAEEGEVPPLCVRCGRPAAVYRRLRLGCQPGWSYCLLLFTFWPFLILSVLLRRRLAVLLPFCETHKSYRRNYRLLALGSGGAVVVVIVGILIALIASGHDDSPFLLLWAMFWLAGMLWLIRTVMIQSGALRAIDLTEESIALKGVSGVFIEKLRLEKEEPVAASGTAPKIKQRSARTAQHARENRT